MSPLQTLPRVPTLDRFWLDRAATLAVRGYGHVAPNPLVGCIVLDADGAFLSAGFHRKCGGPHAEVNALQQAGDRARGGTLYVTLEPCHHTGRTPPCTSAIVDAGIARVVVGCLDSHLLSGDGVAALEQANIRVDLVNHRASDLVTAPFRYRLDTGLPWLIAKWAQTLDGAIATRTGDSQWISSARSRALVHRHRGRVDAIMTGIGTVLADDPQLTARHVRLRRSARRILIDPDLQLPLDSNLIDTLPDAPLSVVASPTADASRRAALESRGVEVLTQAAEQNVVPLRPALKTLASRHDLTNVMVECGPGLMRYLVKEDLVRELAVFASPLLMGDQEAIPPLRGRSPLRVIQATRLELCSMHRRDDDVLLRYLVEPVSNPNDSGDSGH